MSEGT